MWNGMRNGMQNGMDNQLRSGAFKILEVSLEDPGGRSGRAWNEAMSGLAWPQGSCGFTRSREFQGHLQLVEERRGRINKSEEVM